MLSHLHETLIPNNGPIVRLTSKQKNAMRYYPQSRYSKIHGIYRIENAALWRRKVLTDIAYAKAEGLREGSRAAGHLLDTGDISVDGNLLQANRLYESTHLIVSAIRDLAAG